MSDSLKEQSCIESGQGLDFTAFLHMAASYCFIIMMTVWYAAMGSGETSLHLGYWCLIGV